MCVFESISNLAQVTRPGESLQEQPTKDEIYEICYHRSCSRSFRFYTEKLSKDKKTRSMRMRSNR